jgi:hypothetical protein
LVPQAYWRTKFTKKWTEETCYFFIHQNVKKKVNVSLTYYGYKEGSLFANLVTVLTSELHFSFEIYTLCSDPKRIQNYKSESF